MLASASPARLATLRAAGLDPSVLVTGADEDQVRADSPVSLVAALAELKADTATAMLGAPQQRTLLLACDSMMELDGQAVGKPGDEQAAVELWRRMRGRKVLLHTGHVARLLGADQPTSLTRVATTVVRFAEVDDEEVAAYARTGEPARVAGGFAINGLAGPFVAGIEGDHHNVVGISLPLLRTMLAELGVAWPTLWGN
ncbi:Maf family protein [Luteococcus peritonei]